LFRDDHYFGAFDSVLYLLRCEGGEILGRIEIAATTASNDVEADNEHGVEALVVGIGLVEVLEVGEDVLAPASIIR